MPPQICIHGQLDTAEQQVLDALGSLPEEAMVYAQPKLVHRSEVRYPDFVIVYHEWGVIVLEVKGWYDITDRDRRSVWLRGRSEPKSSPVEQARGAVHVLENMLKRDPDLIGYAGTLDFYYAYGGPCPFCQTRPFRGWRRHGAKTISLENKILVRIDCHANFHSLTVSPSGAVG